MRDGAYFCSDFGPAEAAGRSQTRPVERENIKQPSLLKCSNITGKQITFVDFNRNTISFYINIYRKPCFLLTDLRFPSIITLLWYK